MILKILAICIIVYLIWALIHHKRDKSLTFAIFLEYLLLSVLSIVLLFGVIFA